MTTSTKKHQNSTKTGWTCLCCPKKKMLFFGDKSNLLFHVSGANERYRKNIKLFRFTCFLQWNMNAESRWSWNTCLFPCLTVATETGSRDTPLVLSSRHPPTPQPHPCPCQPTLNKLWSSVAQTAARCHALHPRCQHRVTEADDGLCVPSNTHVSVRDCQIVSNSPHPTRKYLPSRTHSDTHTLHRLAQYPDLSDPGGCGSVQRHWQLRLWHANKSAVDEVMLWIKSTFDA